MSWRDDPEYQGAEAKFNATGDVRFAALAVGIWWGSQRYPANPPLWALEGCLALYDRARAGLEPVITSTPGGRPYPDDEVRVRWVAERRGLFGDARTPRELFHERLKAEGILDVNRRKAHVQRLLNYYGAEAQDSDGNPINAHIGRAAQLHARERWMRVRRIRPTTDSE